MGGNGGRGRYKKSWWQKQPEIKICFKLLYDNELVSTDTFEMMSPKDFKLDLLRLDT